MDKILSLKSKKASLLKKQLAAESKLVRNNSLDVLKEFEALEGKIKNLANRFVSC